MRVRQWTLLAAAFVIALTLTDSAQQKPPIPSLGETIEVNLVNVDVFVTDKAGNRVRGLTKNDFEILENGKPQPITNFTEYVGQTTAAPAAATTVAKPEPHAEPAVAPRQKRTIVVFIERFYLPNFRTDPFFASIKQMLHEAVQPGDRAMVVTWNRGVLLTEQRFTDSLPALDKAIDAVAKLSAKPVDDLRAETRWMINESQSFDDYAASQGLSTNGSGVADMEMDYLAQKDKWTLEQKVSTINALIRSVAADEGKKVMLLVTHRLSRQAGADFSPREVTNEVATRRRSARAKEAKSSSSAAASGTVRAATHGPATRSATIGGSTASLPTRSSTRSSSAMVSAANTVSASIRPSGVSSAVAVSISLTASMLTAPRTSRSWIVFVAWARIRTSS